MKRREKETDFVGEPSRARKWGMGWVRRVNMIGSGEEDAGRDVLLLREGLRPLAMHERFVCDK